MAQENLPNYCECSSSAMAAVSGKDILVLIYGDNNELLALAGQQSLTLNRTASSIELSAKDTDGSWMRRVHGMKDWGIDTGGFYVVNEASMRKLEKAFAEDEKVCVVIKNQKAGTYMFGGTALISDFPLDAPYDDALTYSLTLNGDGPLVNLMTIYVTPKDFEVTIPSTGSVNISGQIIGAKGTVTAATTATGVTPTVSGDILSIAVASTAEEGIARVIVTDTHGDEADTYEVRVFLTSPAV